LFPAEQQRITRLLIERLDVERLVAGRIPRMMLAIEQRLQSVD
jgi:hypothetical protein